MNNKKRISKGVHYYEDKTKAIQIHAEVLKTFPTARIVPYIKGYAVQYYKSGPYYPQSVGK
jgi:hypothetical protein